MLLDFNFHICTARICNVTYIYQMMLEIIISKFLLVNYFFINSIYVTKINYNNKQV